jgi:hypothetical protein
VQIFKNIPESDFFPYEPNKDEAQIIAQCYGSITPMMVVEHFEKSKPAIVQNDKRVNNWIENQRGQYIADSDEMRSNIGILDFNKLMSNHFQEKVEIQKKIDKLEKDLKKRDTEFHKCMLDIERQAEKERNAFNAQFEVDPVAIINLVVVF